MPWEQSIVKSLTSAKNAATGAYEKFGAIAVPKSLAAGEQVGSQIEAQLVELRRGIYPMGPYATGAHTGRQELINEINNEITALKKAAAAMPAGAPKTNLLEQIAAYEKGLAALGSSGTGSPPSSTSPNTTPAASTSSTRSTGDFIKGNVEGGVVTTTSKPTVNVYIGQQRINDLVDTRVEWHDQQVDTMIGAGATIR